MLEFFSMCYLHRLRNLSTEIRSNQIFGKKAYKSHSTNKSIKVDAYMLPTQILIWK